jgi:hypothetical protein
MDLDGESERHSIPSGRRQDKPEQVTFGYERQWLRRLRPAGKTRDLIVV